MESVTPAARVEFNSFQLPSPQFPPNPSQVLYKCLRCNENFSSDKGLGIHLTKMHDSTPKIYACLGCFKSYRTNYELKVHQRKVHQNTAKINCVKCGKHFSSKSSFQVHSKKFHPILPTIN